MSARTTALTAGSRTMTRAFTSPTAPTPSWRTRMLPPLLPRAPGPRDSRMRVPPRRPFNLIEYHRESDRFTGDISCESWSRRRPEIALHDHPLPSGAGEQGIRRWAGVQKAAVEDASEEILTLLAAVEPVAVLVEV